MNMHEQHHIVCYPGPRGNRNQEELLKDSKVYIFKHGGRRARVYALTVQGRMQALVLERLACTHPFILSSLPLLSFLLSKTFVTIWPNYLDADKSLPQGRRIPKDKACPRPSVHDISDLLVQWRLAHIVEQHKR